MRSGELYGGCIESFYNALAGEKYKDTPSVYKTYKIWPDDDEWSKKILFLETSEEKPSPEKLKKMLMALKERGILAKVQGIIVGKPIDEVFYDEYKDVWREIFDDLDTPVLYNLNFGHAVPRCILPYGAKATVNFDQQKVSIER